MAGITLVTGGARSGKSDHALSLVLGPRDGTAVFVATAEAFDDEMRQRIEKHRRERPADMPTIEAPVDLAGALRSLPAGTGIAVIDCLTVWMSNLMHHLGPDADSYRPVQELLEFIERPPCDLVFVTNEVGLGIVPENAMARRFRDLAGGLNRAVAARADRVIFMVCGIPVQAKPPVAGAKEK
ncbi:MAG TPA: bifunctional adenosylcobinamide kinase/adenosylcobinamide-phosphate guanylyltransferase [Candidatus Ozemobacteraceae bacterium]|nr:bifunctional adenosylcobinamide kinase/adenosylcobinamide-phosphate guanylyltransferase [Candidatus Ozemobacteraceae bacterium]HQG27862.1 bifunctional adenosylcobinamide kinase/adenosylcobinamide-phosphate guanylyltransferase [Candidatus Ozemobacteraceae bacterium]